MFPIIVACFWNVVINFLLTQFLFCRESTTACWEHIISSNFFCKHKIFEWLKSLDCSLLPSAYDIHSVVDSVTNNEIIFQTQTLRHSYVYAFPDCSTLTQASMMLVADCVNPILSLVFSRPLTYFHSRANRGASGRSVPITSYSNAAVYIGQQMAFTVTRTNHKQIKNAWKCWCACVCTCLPVCVCVWSREVQLTVIAGLCSICFQCLFMLHACLAIYLVV